MRTAIVTGIATLALLAAAPAGAATIHVDCGRANLQKKINRAAAGSTLEIKGRCIGTFTISKNLKLVGDPKATLDGNGGGLTLAISGAGVRLAHVVVTGGHNTDPGAQGGGIRALASNLTLSHGVVKANIADGAGGQAFGGGIYSDGGTLRILNSVIRGNIARATSGIALVAGGGIYRNESLTIIGSTIENNRAVATSQGTSAMSQGGGLLVDEGNLLVKSSRFSGNLSKVASSGGPATAEGGGVHLSDMFDVTMRKSVLSANEARVTSEGTAADAHGGGLAGGLNTGLLAATRLSANAAHASSTGDANASGGGASLFLGDLTVDSSRVASNLAEAEGGAGNALASGGGLDVSAGSLAIRTSTFDRNTATAPSGAASAQGGGLATTGDLAVFRSTISRNRASAAGTILGGGLVLLNAGASGAITNSTVAKNTALGSPARGGGVDTFSDLDVTSSTVVGNSGTIGGGIYREVQTTTLLATLIAGNSAASSPQCSGPLETGGWNLVGSTIGCVINAPKGSDRLNKPARIGKLGDHGGPTETIPLGSKSPGKNAIPAGSCPVGRDQRGVKRPQGSRCDIGAFERKT